MARVVFAPERGQRVPIHIWAREVTPATVRQLQSIASQPYIEAHVAAMADAHVSEGIAVGTVFATARHVVPAALGGDLGCGMTALRFDLAASSLDLRALTSLLDDLTRAIPAGDRVHGGRGIAVPDALFAGALSTRSLDHAREALAPRHLGTLGGGNHFLELERDTGGDVWLLVHSGSRGLGAAIAAHHARATASAAGQGTTALAALDVTTEEGAAYLRDMEWALTFARANREALIHRAATVLADATGGAPDLASRIDVHHNFVAREVWSGRALLVHRKGAVAAPEGALALVPGSMGTASYVVRGRGNPEAFGSCSHGAGRVMSRREARAAITPRALAASMRRVVFARGRARDLVEEAPAAYRDIGEVLEDQEDLVTRVLRLEPLAVLKG